MKKQVTLYFLFKTNFGTVLVHLSHSYVRAAIIEALVAVVNKP